MANNGNASPVRRLVIRVSRHSLSFSTTEGSEVVYVPYPLKSGISIAANMREALQSVPLLGQSYGRVLVMVDSPVLMIPADQFAEDTIAAYYQQAFTHCEQQVMAYTILSDLNSVAVFSVAKDLRVVLQDAFGEVRFVAALAPLWRHLNQRSYTGPHNKLYAYFHEKKLDVFSFAQNRFKFCNSFDFNSTDDAIYYILAAWKQLGMTAEHDELYLTGDMSGHDSLKDALEQFIKRVFVINPVGEFNRVNVAQIPGIPYDLVIFYVKGL